jgi:hypothetical protein
MTIIPLLATACLRALTVALNEEPEVAAMNLAWTEVVAGAAAPLAGLAAAVGVPAALPDGLLGELLQAAAPSASSGTVASQASLGRVGAQREIDIENLRKGL